MKRKALFVGINAYNDSAIADLSFAIADAAALYGQFCALGFSVKLLNDQTATREKVMRVFREFTSDLGTGDVFLFYFAGHGFTQVGGGGQLLVARDDTYDLLCQGYGGGIPYDYLTRTLERRGCHSVFVLDACRSDILSHTRGVGCPTRDLVPKERLVGKQENGGSMVAMRSCSPRQLSHEVPKLEHGLYTAALIDVLRQHVTRGEAISFDAGLSDAVAGRMSTLAAQHGITGRQDPEFVKSGLVLPCVWPLNKLAVPARQMSVQPLADTKTKFESPESASNDENLEHGRNVEAQGEGLVSSGKHKAIVKRCVRTVAVLPLVIGRPMQLMWLWLESRNWQMLFRVVCEILHGVKWCVGLPFVLGVRLYKEIALRLDSHDPRPGEEKTVMLPGGEVMTFCWCPATTSRAWTKISGGRIAFLMGSPADEIGRQEDEIQHEVILTEGFWMGKYEVTQAQWESVMGSNPSRFKGSRYPVERVMWTDCQEFIQKINGMGRVSVALPTEAQWEYACRAGTITAFSFGPAYYSRRCNCLEKTFGLKGSMPVGSFVPNAWGLYDTHGNVWEWCQDTYGEYRALKSYNPKHKDAFSFDGLSEHVRRGGAWCNPPSYCRSAARSKGGLFPDRFFPTGLRLVCFAESCGKCSSRKP